MEKNSEVIADSGELFDNELAGGRLGLYSFSQDGVFWSNLRYECLEEYV